MEDKVRQDACIFLLKPQGFVCAIALGHLFSDFAALIGMPLAAAPQISKALLHKLVFLLVAVGMDEVQIVLDWEEIALDEPIALADGQEMMPDELKVSLDKVEMTMDGQEIALDREEIALDEPTDGLDRQKVWQDVLTVAPDEEEMTIYELTIAMDEPTVASDKPTDALDEQEIACDAPEIA